MSIDMAQFHQVFFEESFEGLDVMENGLLNMDPREVDPEEINSIFGSSPNQVGNIHRQIPSGYRSSPPRWK